jgi:hypothetical protein
MRPWREQAKSEDMNNTFTLSGDNAGVANTKRESTTANDILLMTLLVSFFL